ATCTSESGVRFGVRPAAESVMRKPSSLNDDSATLFYLPAYGFLRRGAPGGRRGPGGAGPGDPGRGRVHAPGPRRAQAGGGAQMQQKTTKRKVPRLCEMVP